MKFIKLNTPVSGPSSQALLNPRQKAVPNGLSTNIPIGTLKASGALVTDVVENAIKIARRYTGRPRIISFDRGFHGRTYMTMYLTGKVKNFKAGFERANFY
ncbi:aminotransferase class III-fold pyridoxal phosphate-dependent enzyme [Siminovitchia acidinfaciens]|uniref:Aminotransferase class III-fold pyridoxal phosphate-dependent enzyme n=1 Tax=Siminovitchia acidinfaciens TaxID=2321395 RepID=A0A429Y7B9_9BACI|nr:aminotransferase class III-fold pyridoxal phosphate-dependent enzyme [Siminovitchia acidinfaciens]